MHITDDGGLVVTVDKTMSRSMWCGQTYTSHPITYIGQPGPKKLAIDVPAPRAAVAADGPTQLQIRDLTLGHSKAFPSPTILVRALLLSPMFSDPPGLAGLGSA